MSVNLIFKIAAVGILVGDGNQPGAKAQWAGRTCIFNQSGRTFDCAVLDCSIHI